MRKPFFLSIGTALLLWLFTFSRQPLLVETFSDGPYLFYEDGELLARWMDSNRLQETSISNKGGLDIPKEIAPSFDPSYIYRKGIPHPRRQSYYSNVSRIAAISDVHGQYDVTIKLLERNGIIDQNQDWVFGDGHLVITGDVFDRGDQVVEILWLIHKLEQQAEAAGGKVHFTLGNHELMVLEGDLRYIHKKYRYTSAVFKMPYDSIFNKDSYLGKWLRTKPVAVSINDIAFVHGGFSELFLKYGADLNACNEAFTNHLQGVFTKSPVQDSIANFLFDMEGPLWYRGYFNEEEFTRAQAQKILKKMDKNHIVVGHTSHEAIISLFGNKIIGIDSSIKFGKSGEILLYERGNFYRGTIFGEKIKLV